MLNYPTTSFYDATELKPLKKLLTKTNDTAVLDLVNRLDPIQHHISWSEANTQRQLELDNFLATGSSPKSLHRLDVDDIQTENCPWGDISLTLTSKRGLVHFPRSLTLPWSVPISRGSLEKYMALNFLYQNAAARGIVNAVKQRLVSREKITAFRNRRTVLRCRQLLSSKIRVPGYNAPLSYLYDYLSVFRAVVMGLSAATGAFVAEAAVRCWGKVGGIRAKQDKVEPLFRKSAKLIRNGQFWKEMDLLCGDFE